MKAAAHYEANAAPHTHAAHLLKGRGRGRARVEVRGRGRLGMPSRPPRLGVAVAG